jgi:cell surface protein SprA
VKLLRPDTPKADQFEGESTIYVDDFEGSQSTIDMRSPYAWSLASTPDRNALSTYDFNANSNDFTVLKSQISLVFYRPHFLCPKTLWDF